MPISTGNSSTNSSRCQGLGSLLCSRLQLSTHRSPSFITNCCYVGRTLTDLLIFSPGSAHPRTVYFALYKCTHDCLSTKRFTLTDCTVLTTHTHLHTHPFNGPLSRTTRVSRYQKGKTNLDFTEARDSEWQWHQLGHTQVCTSLQTDNHASTAPLSFFTGRMPFLPPNQQRQSTVQYLPLNCITYR